MAVPEAQLEVWSHQAAPGPSRDTYRSVKGTLEDPASPFADKSPDVFLQGSYGNDTNVVRESDVDVVACTAAAFYHDAETLAPEQFQAFSRAYPSKSSYTYSQYKKDVTSWLTKKYGSGVQAGKKAIFIPGGPNRRDCDVLPAMEYRYYYQFNSATDQSHAKGICFYLPDGTQIVNFPKQHSSNCTARHQATNSRFKPVVRMYKNMRNHMVDRNMLQGGVAPSYFIEGMLYNVPDDNFRGRLADAFAATFNFIEGSDRSKFRCANGIHMLFGNSQVNWASADCQTFLDSLRRLWTNWQ